MGGDSRARRRASRRVYLLQLGLGAGGLAACALVLAEGVRTVHVHPAAAHHLSVAGLRLTYQQEIVEILGVEEADVVAAVAFVVRIPGFPPCLGSWGAS